MSAARSWIQGRSRITIAMAPGSGRRALIVAAIAAAALGVFALHVPTCPMAAMFGVPCPGCGLTRATVAALHGDFHRAFALHPLVFVITPLYAGMLAWIAHDFIVGRAVGGVQTLGPLASRADHPRLALLVTAGGIALVAVVFGVWVARFFGWFGGPVPVETVWAWSAR